MSGRRSWYAIEWSAGENTVWPDGSDFGAVYRFLTQAARDYWVSSGPSDRWGVGYRTAYSGERARKLRHFYEIDASGEVQAPWFTGLLSDMYASK